ncbi:MAG: hypothetical protein LBI30_00390 [Holosporales bacterium]|nr:hypothetical protein [Holosporales bacterium]
MLSKNFCILMCTACVQSVIASQPIRPESVDSEVDPLVRVLIDMKLDEHGVVLERRPSFNRYNPIVKRSQCIPPSNFLSDNRLNFRDAASYLAYARQKRIPPTAIFGSGRGGLELGYDCCRYLNPYDYLTINWATNPNERSVTKTFYLPDIDCDVGSFDPLIFAPDQTHPYKYVLIEGFSSFVPKTFKLCLSLLKSGG